MYPTLSDLLKDLFGFYLPLPIQSFGFFMAISILLAAWLLHLELKRKEKEGLLHPVQKKIIVGKSASALDLILNFLGGFILAYKVVGAILHYKLFALNPQEYILSTEGSLWAGIAFGALSVYLKYSEKEKQKLPEPKIQEETILPHHLVGEITIACSLMGLLGAKIFDNLEHWNEFTADPIGSLLSFSGLTFYGSLAFGIPAGYYVIRRYKIPLIYMLDAIAPALMLAYAVGRIGCQVSGDGDWGIVNVAAKPQWLQFLPDWVWSYRYPHNVINAGDLIENCSGKYCHILPQPVFPTPLYETTVCIFLFVFLWSIRKKIKIPGILFSIYLIVNGVERFLIETIRVNERYHFLGINPTQAEIIAVILVLTGIAGLIYWGRIVPQRKILIHQK